MHFVGCPLSVTYLGFGQAMRPWGGSPRFGVAHQRLANNSCATWMGLRCRKETLFMAFVCMTSADFAGGDQPIENLHRFADRVVRIPTLRLQQIDGVHEPTALLPKVCLPGAIRQGTSSRRTTNGPRWPAFKAMSSAGCWPGRCRFAAGRRSAVIRCWSPPSRGCCRTRRDGVPLWGQVARADRRPRPRSELAPFDRRSS